MECCFENPLPNITVCRNNYQTTIYHDHEPQLFLVLKGQLPPQNRYHQESLHRPGDRWPRRRPHHIQAACMHRTCNGKHVEKTYWKHGVGCANYGILILRNNHKPKPCSLSKVCFYRSLYATVAWSLGKLICSQRRTRPHPKPEKKREVVGRAGFSE